MSEKVVAIIGNGISGITAARHIRKNSNHQIVVISAETDHFFSRTALMYIYMGHMKYEHTKPYEDHFWKKNKIELVRKYINKVDVNQKILHYKEGGSLNYDQLIIACGSKSNKFGWPGQDLPGVQGLYSMQDLQLMEENSKQGIKRAIIVGGGLIGVEMAEMLLTRKYPVTFLVREDRFWGNVLPKEDGELIARHMVNEHHIDLRLKTELKEIKSGSNGRVSSVITSTGEEIECDFVGLTPGVSPNIDFLKDSSIKLNRGVVVNEFLETNIPDVYAIGDCAEFEKHPTGRRNIEQVWYTGRMMGEAIAQTIVGNRTPYAPGVWFNSAKFFDIEYQTYGDVSASPQQGEHQFYWEYEDGKIAMRMVFSNSDKKLIGINVYGIRLRHEKFDEWIKSGKTVTYCLENLESANFDPEFYKRYEDEIILAFNEAFPSENVSIPKKSFFQKLLS